MNIVCFLGILIIVTSEASVPEQITNKAEIEQRILLRKLQKRSDPKGDANSVTWNVILADVLVNKIKIFSFNTAVEPSNVAEEPKENILTHCVGQVLAIYKTLYDKYKTDSRKVLEPTNVNENPKEEFEVIEPLFKEISCIDCVESVDDRASFGDKICPQGQEINEQGGCVIKPNRMILAIPQQCPIGYRADRLGYCRKSF